MTYERTDGLPDNVRDSLPEHAQDVYREAYNDALTRNDDREGDASPEEAAHRAAWSAVEDEYEKAKDGEWVRSDE